MDHRLGATIFNNVLLLFKYYTAFIIDCITKQQTMSSKANPKVYMDIQMGSKGIGRMIFQLFTDFTPKTAQNFRGICAGDYNRKDNETRLSYHNTRFHRVVPGFVVQGGDITNGDGTGGYSIYGRTFNDENFSRKHSCAGMLSMANSGRNTNSSQFFVTLKACPDLDDKHVVFGQLVDGIQVLRQIAKVATDKKYKPRVPVIIVGCGQIGDFKNFLTFDPFQKSAQQKIREKREQIIKDQHLMRKLISQGIDPNQTYNYKRKLQKCEKDLLELLKQQKILEEQQQQEKQKQEEQQPQQIVSAATISQKLKEKLGEKNIHRFIDLKLKINESKVHNSKAAVQEEIRQNDANYKKMIKKKQYQQKRQKIQKQLQAKGIDKSKTYMNRNSLKKQQQLDEKMLQKQEQNFGWNVFGQEASYKAYSRRCDKLNFNPQMYKQQMENPSLALQISNKPTQQSLAALVADIQKQEEKRSEFSRRRIVDEDDKIDYINERNMVFNKKLDRSFGKYTEKIKTSLEMNNIIK